MIKVMKRTISNKTEIPVKINQELTASIDSFGINDDPIIKIDTYVIFIKNYGDNKLEQGQEVNVRITRALERYGFAELIKK